MFVVVILLGFVAVAMAKKTPNSGTVDLPPDTSLPATGATDKFSPALTGGSPLVATDNRLRMDMTYKYAPSKTDFVTLAPRKPGTISGILGGLTNAQSSLPTEAPKPVASLENYRATYFGIQPRKY